MAADAAKPGKEDADKVKVVVRKRPPTFDKISDKYEKIFSGVVAPRESKEIWRFFKSLYWTLLKLFPDIFGDAQAPPAAWPISGTLFLLSALFMIQDEPRTGRAVAAVLCDVLAEWWAAPGAVLPVTLCVVLAYAQGKITTPRLKVAFAAALGLVAYYDVDSGVLVLRDGVQGAYGVIKFDDIVPVIRLIKNRPADLDLSFILFFDKFKQFLSKSCLEVRVGDVPVGSLGHNGPLAIRLMSGLAIIVRDDQFGYAEDMNVSHLHQLGDFDAALHRFLVSNMFTATFALLRHRRAVLQHAAPDDREHVAKALDALQEAAARKPDSAPSSESDPSPGPESAIEQLGLGLIGVGLKCGFMVLAKELEQEDEPAPAPELGVFVREWEPAPRNPPLPKKKGKGKRKGKGEEAVEPEAVAEAAPRATDGKQKGKKKKDKRDKAQAGKARENQKSQP